MLVPYAHAQVAFAESCRHDATQVLPMRLGRLADHRVARRLIDEEMEIDVGLDDCGNVAACHGTATDIEQVVKGYTLAYHVHKHHSELPKGEQFKPGQAGGPASEQEAYLAAALKTIEQDAAVAAPKATPDGTGQVYTFQRVVVEGTKTFNMRALILVGYDGSAVMLTFMPGGG